MVFKPENLTYSYTMRPVIIGFGLLILSLLILFRISEVNIMQGNVKLEIIVALVSIVFFFIGLYFNRRSNEKNAQEKKDHVPEVTIDYEQIKKTGLTQREHDVLLKMAEGLSNQEIATSLYLSESTIKTHVSNILFKLDAKRRTQAIQAAKQKKIIP